MRPYRSIVHSVHRVFLVLAVSAMFACGRAVIGGAASPPDECSDEPCTDRALPNEDEADERTEEPLPTDLGTDGTLTDEPLVNPEVPILLTRPCRVRAYPDDPEGTHDSVSAAANDTGCLRITVPATESPFIETELVVIDRAVTIESDGGGRPVVQPKVDRSWISLGEGGNLEIIGLDFEQANAPESCGSVVSVTGGATVTLTDAEFRENRAEQGGAVCVTQQSHAIIDSARFFDNQGARGGAIYVSEGSELRVNERVTFGRNEAAEQGGALYVSLSEVNVSNAEFFENRVDHPESASGGAIFGTLARVRCDRCYFHDNSVRTTDSSGAGADGGAIAITGSLELRASTLSSNVASTATSTVVAGGLRATCATPSDHQILVNTTVHGNVTSGGTIGLAAKFEGPAGETPCKVSIRGTTITDNRRLGEQGMTIDAAGIGWGESLDAAVAYTVVHGHWADCLLPPDSTSISSEYNFWTSSACDGFFGWEVLHVGPTDPRLGPLSVPANDWIPVRIPYPDSSLIDSCSTGCSALVDDARTQCEQSCRENCLAHGDDLSIDAMGAERPWRNSCDIGAVESIAECGNGVEERGERCDDGNQDNTDACPSDCWRRECRVGDPLMDSAATHDSVTAAISDESCFRVTVPAIEGFAYRETVPAELDYREILIQGEGERALVELAVGETWMTIGSNASATLRNLDIRGATPTQAFGSVANVAGRLTVDDVQITDASAYAGAFAVYGGNLLLQNSAFERNQSTAFGGVVYSLGGNIRIAESRFLENDSPLGGVVYASGSSVIDVRDSHFENNRADGTGDARAVGGVFYTTGSQLTLGTSSLIGNGAYGDSAAGGALFAIYGMLEVEDSWFDRNETVAPTGTPTGGALYSEGNLTIRRSSFTSNSSTQGDAASGSGAIEVFCQDSVQAHLVENSTIHQNGGDQQIGFSGNNPSCHADVVHATITQDPDSLPIATSGVEVNAFEVDVRYSILHGHPIECARDDRGTILGEHNLWNASCHSDAPAIGRDPRLGLLTDGPLPVRIPLSDSPAVDICHADLGCTTETLEDQLGNHRPSGSSSDAGSVER